MILRCILNRMPIARDHTTVSNSLNFSNTSDTPVIHRHRLDEGR